MTHPSHRAWVWRGAADPAELELIEKPLAMPGTGDVLIRNAAIGLNPVDWNVLIAIWSTGSQDMVSMVPV